MNNVRRGPSLLVFEFAGVGDVQFVAIGQRQRARIARLSTAQGVEHGLIQNEATLGGRAHAGGAFGQVGVLVEKCVGHGAIIGWRRSLYTAVHEPCHPLLV